MKCDFDLEGNNLGETALYTSCNNGIICAKLHCILSKQENVTVDEDHLSKVIIKPSNSLDFFTFELNVTLTLLVMVIILPNYLKKF